MESKCLRDYVLLRPLEEWCEGDGTVLLWPANGDPPEVGHPLDTDFDEEEWKYYSLIPNVKTKEELSRLRPKSRRMKIFDYPCVQIPPINIGNYITDCYSSDNIRDSLRWEDIPIKERERVIEYMQKKLMEHIERECFKPSFGCFEG